MKKRDRAFRPDRIGDYFRAEWLPLGLVTVSGLVYNVGLLAAPWFEGRLAQCLADILGGRETAARMAMLVLAYIAVTLTVQAARFVKRFYVRRFANNINRRMKGVLYANLVRQSRAALEQEGAGELMTKAISDVDDCVEGMRKFTTEVFDTGVALAGYAVMLFVYDWRLALLSLLFTPVSYVCAAWMKKPVQRAGAACNPAPSRKASGRNDAASSGGWGVCRLAGPITMAYSDPSIRPRMNQIMAARMALMDNAAPAMTPKPSAVTMRMGMSFASRTLRQTAKPSSPGSIRSRSRRSKGCSSAAVRPDTPSVQTDTS